MPGSEFTDKPSLPLPTAVFVRREATVLQLDKLIPVVRPARGEDVMQRLEVSCLEPDGLTLHTLEEKEIDALSSCPLASVSDPHGSLTARSSREVSPATGLPILHTLFELIHG